MGQISICYSEDTKEILVDALNDLIIKLEKIKKDAEESGETIDVEKLPGIFHFHTGIDGYIEDVKKLRDEINSSHTLDV